MEFKHTMSFDTIRELKDTMKKGNKHLSNLIVDEAILNIENGEKEIPVVSIFSKEEDLNYDVVIDPEDLIDTLEQNIEIMEGYEDYERCQKIANALKYLKSKQ